MRGSLFVLVTLTLAACGGSPTTPAAPPPLPANVVPRGNMRFPACANGVCTFEGEAINHGPGCAANMRGVSKLFTQAGAELARAEWSLTPASRRLVANETFTYGGCCFPEPAAFATAGYDTVFTFDLVPCS